MAVYLIESKVDQQKLIDHVGEDTAKLFFSVKDRLKSPENDIYYWLKKSPEELENRLQELQNVKTRKEKDVESSKGAELIYNKDGWKVYHITTYAAAVKYGKNTQWCISGSKRWSSGERGEEYFNDYTSQGVEFYFYIKSGDEKYALALTPRNGKYQVFNQEDIEVTSSVMLPNVEGLPKFDFTDELIDGNTYEYTGGEIPESISKHIEKIIVFGGIEVLTDGTFYGFTHLKEVVLPDSVKYLESYVFGNCINLIKINLPDNLVHIGTGAFENCTSLRDIVIPDTVTEIGKSAFMGCNLKEVVLPSKLESIPPHVFDTCWNLEKVVISSAVERVSVHAFFDCRTLREINLPEGLLIIGRGAFTGCDNLTKLVIPDSVYGIHELAFSQCPSLVVYTNNEYVQNYCTENQVPWKPASEYKGLI